MSPDDKEENTLSCCSDVHVSKDCMDYVQASRHTVLLLYYEIPLLCIIVQSKPWIAEYRGTVVVAVRLLATQQPLLEVLEQFPGSAESAQSWY
jgi:hypothetical protein